jgi:Ni/Fe-hydrogenase subunit HybB-like protein
LLLKYLPSFYLSERPLFDRPVLTTLFAIEMVAGIIIPFFMFLQKRIRTDGVLQLRAAGLVVMFGLVLNRFNVSMFGMIQANQQIYYPSAIESIVTIGIIAAHILFFAVVARYFPIFEHHPESVYNTIPESFGRTKSAVVPEKVV